MVILATWLWQEVVNNWPQGRPWSPTHIHTMLCNALGTFLGRLLSFLRTFTVRVTSTQCFGNILGKTFVFSDISNSSNIHAMLCNALETFLGRLLSFLRTFPVQVTNTRCFAFCNVLEIFLRRLLSFLRTFPVQVTSTRCFGKFLGRLLSFLTFTVQLTCTRCIFEKTTFVFSNISSLSHNQTALQ